MKNQPAKKNIEFKAAVPFWLLAVLLGALCLAHNVFSEEPGSDRSPEPIQITADRLLADLNTDTARFSGNVCAIQGNTEIKADQLTLHYQSDGSRKPTEKNEAANIQRITAQGNVRIRFDNRLAVSEQAVYITSERKLILKGPGSKVISGRDEIIGSKITYYRDEGRVAMEGDSQNRVKAVLHSNERGLN